MPLRMESKSGSQRRQRFAHRAIRNSHDRAEWVLLASEGSSAVAIASHNDDAGVESHRSVHLKSRHLESRIG